MGKEPDSGGLKKIDEHAVEIFQKLRDLQKRRDAIAKSHRILVCGDYGENIEILEEIKTKLINNGHPAFLAKDFKPSDMTMPSYDHTLSLMNDFDIIILVDGDCIGTGIDCGLIIGNGTFQTKTILLTNKNFEDMINLSKSYIYYPMYEFWTTREDLIYKAVGLAKKESYRLAKIYIDLHKSTINSGAVSN